MVLESQFNPLLKVPKLDFTQVMNGGAREAIYQAMLEYGFLYIVNLPNFDPLAEVKAMQQFFGLEQSEKEKYASTKHNPANTNILRGYGYTTSKAGQPIEEVFNIGQFEQRNVTIDDVSCRAEYISREPNTWPKEGDFPGSVEFKKVLNAGFTLRIKLARKLVEEIAAAIDYPEFPDKFKEAEFSSFYLKKYTERREEDNVSIYKKEHGYSMTAEDGRILSIPSHTDTTITLLATYSNGGLQAMYKDEWYDVPSVMGSLMLMTGHLVEELTDGKLPSLRHRVLDIKTDRYSTPFFFNPSFHANIAKTCSGKETEVGKKFETFGPWQVTELHRDEPLLLHSTSLN